MAIVLMTVNVMYVIKSYESLYVLFITILLIEETDDAKRR